MAFKLLFMLPILRISLSLRSFYLPLQRLAQSRLIPPPLAFSLSTASLPSRPSPTFRCLITHLGSRLRSLGSQLHLRLPLRILPPSRRSQYHRISRQHRPESTHRVLLPPIDLSRFGPSFDVNLFVLCLLVLAEALFVQDEEDVPGYERHHRFDPVLGDGECRSSRGVLYVDFL